MSKLYEKRCDLKPQIRDALWQYRKDGDLEKALRVIGTLFDETWNVAIDQAEFAADQEDSYNPVKYYTDAIRKLKL